MNPILTTITPYWKRLEMLRLWLRNLRGVTIPEVHHLVYLVGEPLPDWWIDEAPPNVTPISSVCWKDDQRSIGYFHNLGAREAESEWIMKLDVDVLPNTYYFRELLSILSYTSPTVWYNGGMIYISRRHSPLLKVPLDSVAYDWIMKNVSTYSATPYLLPAATNFVCRRMEYLELGGCNELFRGWGWEDYQQIYMLERHQRRECPLPGPITLENVTRRCRDEISRPKAKELWKKNSWLCLFHHWHPDNHGAHMNHNRQVLFEYIKNYDKR